MKSVVAMNQSIEEYLKLGTTSFLLPLKGYSVSYEKSYTLSEIKKLKKMYSDCEFFVVMNKTIYNKELIEVEKILQKLEKSQLDGVFFYDLALLYIKQKNNLQIPFVWNQTHFVTNAKTTNFYRNNGVSYALLSGELSKEELKNFSSFSPLQLFYTLLSYPVVAHSRRKLITNSCKRKPELTITEKTTQQKYFVREDKDGTTFFLKKLPNHFSVLKDLNVAYVILNESYIEDHEMFLKLLSITNDFLNHKISEKTLEKELEKYPLEKAPFLDRQTTYIVKKEAKK